MHFRPRDIVPVAQLRSAALDVTARRKITLGWVDLPCRRVDDDGTRRNPDLTVFAPKESSPLPFPAWRRHHSTHARAQRVRSRGFDPRRVRVNFGSGLSFCWLRVRFLETISAPRPPDNREISGKAVLPFLSRLKQSGIGYVILAGSSLFTLSGAQSRYGSGLVSSWRRAARNFFNDLDFFAPEIAKFARPQGHL